jgi:alpha-1,3-mannosyltransferase
MSQQRKIFRKSEVRILQVSRQFLPSIGGIENVMHGLGKALIQKEHTVDVVTLDSIFNTGDIAESTSCIDGLNVYRLPYFGSKRYPIAPGVLKFISDYDIIHIHAIDFFVDYLSLMRPIHHKPIIVNTHGGIFHTPWLRPLKKAYFQSITQLSLRAVDEVICVSQQDYSLFSSIVSETKLHVIGNGVNIEPFLKIDKKIEPGLLLGIGRVVKHKSIEKLIHLLAKLEIYFPNIKLVWIGGDPEGLIPQLKILARELGVASKVEFKGHVSDAEISLLMSQAHLFVSASAYEGFGLSTIEAMSSGTVPVVTPVGIHPEVIQEGETGFLYPDDEQKSLIHFQKILSLDISEIIQIGSKAQAVARQFAWDRVVESYLAVYESVLSKNRINIKAKYAEP